MLSQKEELWFLFTLNIMTISMKSVAWILLRPSSTSKRNKQKMNRLDYQLGQMEQVTMTSKASRSPQNIMLEDLSSKMF